MLQWMLESGDSLVSLKVMGRLTEDECVDMLPKLARVIEREGSLSLLIDLEAFDGIEWRAAWDKQAFGINHWKQVRRIALLGTQHWSILVARIAAALAQSEVRVFESHATALDWVKGEAKP